MTDTQASLAPSIEKVDKNKTITDKTPLKLVEYKYAITKEWKKVVVVDKVITTTKEQLLLEKNIFESQISMFKNKIAKIDKHLESLV